MKNFTRHSLSADLGGRLNCTTYAARAIVDHVIDAMAGALARGQKIEFRDFGVLEVKTRKEKLGRNPKNLSSGTYRIPPHSVVKFRAGKKLDSVLNTDR